MARPSDNRRKRELAQQRAQETAATKVRQSRRRRQILAGLVACLVVLSTAGAFLGSQSANRSTAPSTSSTSSTIKATGAVPKPANAGAALSGETPCPAEDGSSPRTTSFASAPPMCIDTGSFYVATINTPLGPISIQLNPRVSPQSVNAFIVLALYHFYEDQPVTNVADRASFTIGTSFAPGLTNAPGFAINSEQPAGGTIFTPGFLAIRPTSASGFGAQLVVSTFEKAPNNDQNVNPLGIMLSGEDALFKINTLATQSGDPAAAVSISSITIRKSSPIPN